LELGSAVSLLVCMSMCHSLTANRTRSRSVFITILLYKRRNTIRSLNRLSLSESLLKIWESLILLACNSHSTQWAETLRSLV
jgi:hypothetical protein